MERCTNSVRVQQNLIIALQCEKMLKRNVVALGVPTAKLAMNTKRGQKGERLALCIAGRVRENCTVNRTRGTT
jgi:hypothetical protein